MLCNAYFCKHYAKVQLGMRKFSGLLAEKFKATIKISLLMVK
jgi:hypothetical protein